MDNLQYVSALVMYPDCSPVCHGQSSVCMLTALVMYPDCSPVWYGQSSVCMLTALVMYPDCSPVWHGQSSVCMLTALVMYPWQTVVLSGMGSYSSVCTSPCHVPRLWSCLAWAVFSVLTALIGTYSGAGGSVQF